jgi:2-amino-4-hydroxy-6-hydroxymethyldihydropteridine diphosphokinase
MNESHLAYLNLGSNIQPETNLPKAVKLLSEYGEILQVSKVWESAPVGSEGSNYLNACLLFKSTFNQIELKTKVVHLIENQLGRKRSDDKFAPRPMDIDIILFDNVSTSDTFWNLAYVVVPLADIYPDCKNPLTGETVHETATRLSQEVWLETRQGIIG